MCVGCGSGSNDISNGRMVLSVLMMFVRSVSSFVDGEMYPAPNCRE